jgi:pimeloyl-ACP methyl ester carboxylesterase
MKVNGIEIFIETLAGKGKLNFVLVHNAGGNHNFFTHQIDILKKYGNIIWFDLPGHSQSPENFPDNQMKDLSSFIGQICTKLALDNICLIGLNNGADIVIETALTYPLPIKNIILIDPPLFMTKAFIDEIEMFIKALENEHDNNAFASSLSEALFIKTQDKNKALAQNAFSNVNKETLKAIFKGLIEWDKNSRGKLKNIRYPTLCILTDEHHCTYSKLRAEAPHFEIGKVIGSKCWATLEVPEQINAMIERFLKIHF